MQPTILSQYTGIYTDRYYKLLNIEINNDCYDLYKDKKEETITNIQGKFKAIYNVKNYYPNDSFGLYSWKSGIGGKPIEISFYENETLLFTKTSTILPCLIVHCLDNENQTRENTFFSTREEWKINIYNMNNEFIRQAKIGPDCIVDFKKVNDKYGIGITEEMCCKDPFTGLFNSDQFFNQKENETVTKPYDNCRTAVCLRSDSQDFSELRYFPLICTETGFVVEDLRTNEILSEIIPYDKVHSQEIDFYDNEKESLNDKMYESLQKAGFNINEIQQQLIKTGTVYISAKDLPTV